MDLKLLTYDDKEVFERFSNYIIPQSYEYSFASLYLWRTLCQTKYTIINNSLLIQKYEDEKGRFFMFPFSKTEEEIYKTIDYIESIKNTLPSATYFLGDLEDVHVNFLKTKYNFDILEDTNHFEYIYLTKDLINLSGAKYHKKRTHYNNFVNSYNFTIKTIDNENTIFDCIQLLSKWERKKCSCSNELLVEPYAIKDIICKLSDLNLKSIAVYVDSQLVGFSIGEYFNDTAIIHIEKCNVEYKGAYAFINREFLKMCFSNTTYVNRQEDCGNEGLKQSKKSYYPHHILKKYLIKIK